MKLIKQESDKVWHVEAYSDGKYIRTREHRLHLIELASEFSFDRFWPHVGKLNSVPFGGIAEGHLLFMFSADCQGDYWSITAILRERTRDTRNLTFRTFDNGQPRFVEIPQYAAFDFHDLLPHVEPFPSAEGDGMFEFLACSFGPTAEV